MAQVAKEYRDRLPELKKSVESWHEYFLDNINRYKEFMRFVFRSGLTDSELESLRNTDKPTIEFNILEAYISRQRAEFSKNQPSFTVTAADGVPLQNINKEFMDTMQVIESHLRSIFSDGINDSLMYNVFSDLLAGGYSVVKIHTDYVNERSFEQNIVVERAFDPLLCGFDPLARESHKGDGRFYFETYPMTRNDFERDYGSDLTNRMKFVATAAGFGWSYKNEKEDIIIVIDFYEKKTKREKILKLSNGHVVTKKEYEEFLEEWEKSERIEQPPIPVGDSRYSEFTTICRYRFCETEVIAYEETDYKYLPGVFIDGNSVMLNNGDMSYQMTRPFVYHAQGIQRLKTFAGQSLANELENTVQHKWIAAIEGIPEKYLSAYRNPQKADVLVYNHFLDSRAPDVVLPPPQVVQRAPIPPEITNTFKMSDEMTQAILGSYDNSMGINRADLSGIAIARGAMQSNQAAVPYIMGYLKGLNRVATIIVDLIPKYYRTPRSLPLMLPSGEKTYTIINKQGTLYMNYDPNSLEVKVEAGASFAMQKELALQTIINLMQASPTFAQFINQEGLGLLLDNLDIRGIDQMKAKAAQFEMKVKQQEQQMQQMQMQQAQQASQGSQTMQQLAIAKAQKELQSPAKEQIEMLKVQHGMKMDEAELQLREQEIQDEFIGQVSAIRNDQVTEQLNRAKIDAENTRSSIEAVIALDKHHMEKMRPHSEGPNGQ